MDFSLRRASVKRGSGIASTFLSSAAKILRKIPIGGLINTAIDALPVELHLPGYQYCGPGTKLQTRLSRGDPGINELDRACKAHDIAYSEFHDSVNRRTADKTLAAKAWERVTSKDASLGERAAALIVGSAMKGKTIVGGGKCKRGKRKTAKKGGALKRKTKGSKKKLKKDHQPGQ